MAHKRKILTVLLLSAGCGTTSTPAKQRHSSAAEVPVPTVASASTAPIAAPMTPVAAVVAMPPEPADDNAQPQARLDLRLSLYNTDRETALAASARFRALCDADGYPLVGNIANKGQRYDVSEYCSDLRASMARGAS